MSNNHFNNPQSPEQELIRKLSESYWAVQREQDKYHVIFRHADGNFSKREWGTPSDWNNEGGHGKSPSYLGNMTRFRNFLEADGRIPPMPIGVRENIAPFAFWDVIHEAGQSKKGQVVGIEYKGEETQND